VVRQFERITGHSIFPLSDTVDQGVGSRQELKLKNPLKEFANTKSIVRYLMHIFQYSIHISLADCIWQCLADSPSCLESFLLYEGMFRMLELLEISAGPGAQMHILSCILELCEYPRCIDQLLYWKRRVRDDIQRLTHGQDFNLAGSSIASVQKIEPGDKVGEVLRDQDLSLSALLCEIWREEEERLGVKRDKDGVIACKLLFI